jgi:hypothetical protein
MSDLAQLRTVRRLAEELAPSGISQASIRWSIFNRERNGLAASGAIVRPPGTRRVLIDRVRYENWLRSGRDPGAHGPEPHRSPAHGLPAGSRGAGLHRGAPGALRGQLGRLR